MILRSEDIPIFLGFATLDSRADLNAEIEANKLIYYAYLSNGNDLLVIDLACSDTTKEDIEFLLAPS